MPELPEVETTLRGLHPHMVGNTVEEVIIRESRLRWPVNNKIIKKLSGAKIDGMTRRGKYLIIEAETGYAIWHLGMSGSLRMVDEESELLRHDHVDWRLNTGFVLRYSDPRRFGSLHWTQKEPLKHKLLKDLGVEPLSDLFDAEYCYQLARKRSVAIKQFIMNSKIVVGVGNIYANEALFRAGISPKRSVNRVSLERFKGLVASIKFILDNAINQGGTTLRDFVGGDGKPGYFKQQLTVYGRGGEPCTVCNRPLNEIRMGQRATVFCKVCQT